MRHIKPVAPATEPEEPHAVFHDGHECKTTYVTHEKPAEAQVAIVEYEEHPNQLVLPVISSDLGESDLLDLDVTGNLFEAKAVSHKKLFGENGWLGNVSDPSRLSMSSEKHMSQTFINLGKKIKHQVEEFVSYSEFALLLNSCLLTPIPGRGYGEGLSDPIRAWTTALENAARNDDPHLAEPSDAGQDVFGARSHDLCHCKRLPSPAIRHGPGLRRIDQKSQELLGIQEQASSGRVSIRPGHSAPPDPIQHPHSAVQR